MALNSHPGMPQEQHLALSRFCKFYFKKPKNPQNSLGDIQLFPEEAPESGAPFGAQDAPSPVPESLPRNDGATAPPASPGVWGALGVSPCSATVPCPAPGELNPNTILLPSASRAVSCGRESCQPCPRNHLSMEKLPGLLWLQSPGNCAGIAISGMQSCLKPAKPSSELCSTSNCSWSSGQNRGKA